MKGQLDGDHMNFKSSSKPFCCDDFTQRNYDQKMVNNKISRFTKIAANYSTKLSYIYIYDIPAHFLTKRPSKIEWYLTNLPLSKLLELLDTQV